MSYAQGMSSSQALTGIVARGKFPGTNRDSILQSPVSILLIMELGFIVMFGFIKFY